ncbi:IPT/TIG domain-containing protein [Labilibaculum sp. K2S]|uniref:IPT/TIG domain-containing protein n=1 Tax=Labilibaculum sp. K2S TaxID=3056386 RepID=UPI0025A47FEA|nr:IPT/TIG domain-containing protein [Labilibaculum sp. K2S]MDM8161518.1 IPT/TIG domain-containing protein [Labilibaculum sp. K2S]
MKDFKHYCFILLMAFVVCSCQKDEPMVPPVINAIAASDITNTTAVINAEITEAGSEPILKYGFVWTEGYDGVSTLNEGTVEYLNGNPQEGKISFELKNLEQGKHYKYNAFIQTETDTYMNKYGTDFDLASPEITEISPKEGAGGTKVTITGKYFTTNKEAISLKLGSVETEILEASENEITFIAPEGYQGDIEIDLDLIVNGVQSQSEITFTYLDYFQFDTKYLRSGEVFTFIVSNQVYTDDNRKPKIDVKVNGKQCDAFSVRVSQRQSEVDVYLPKDLQAGVATIEMKTSNGEYLFNKNNSLTILPSGVWAKKQDLPSKDLGKGVGFSKDGFGYVLNQKKLYQYNPASNSWTLYKEILSLQDKKIDALGLIDEELLIMQGKTLKTYSFFGDYSQARAEFPGVARDGAASFIVNNAFYYGLGYINEDYQNDLWKYNLDTDEWIRLSDGPSLNHFFSYQKESVFVLEGKVFINGLIYDHGTDTYTDSMVSFYAGKNCLVFNDKCYLIGVINRFVSAVKSDDGSFRFNYEEVIGISDYDFNRDEIVTDTPCPVIGRYKHFTFNINSKIYIGTDDDALEFWEYTPAD